MCMQALFLSNTKDDRAELIGAKGERTANTCEWILSNRNYDKWRYHNFSPPLWISGGPAKGKTMLSIFLTQKLEQHLTKKEALLYFFCAHGDGKRNSSIAIIRGLIFQLLSERPALFKHIIPTFELLNESLFKSTSIEALWNVFEAMIQDHSLDGVYCILDGLDECDETSIKWLFKKITIFQRRTSDTDSRIRRVKIILISRALPKLLPREVAHFSRINLDSDWNEAMKADIRRLIDFEVTKLADEKCYPEELRIAVEKALYHGS